MSRFLFQISIRDGRDAQVAKLNGKLACQTALTGWATKMRKNGAKIGPELVRGLLSIIDGDIFGSYVETATRYGEVCEKLDSIEKCTATTPNENFESAVRFYFSCATHRKSRWSACWVVSLV